MENTTDIREVYVKKWQNHADAFNILGFTSDREASDRIFAIVNELYELIEKVADTKTWKES